MYRERPTIIETDGKTEKSFTLDSRLLKDRIIMIQGEINEYMSQDIVSMLVYLDKISNDDIYMYINSPGGVITDGMAIYDTMNYIKSDVATLCLGQACSMGAFLLSAGTKGKRASLPNSRIMIHQPLGGAYGQVTDIEIQAEEIITLKKNLNKLLAEHTGQPIEAIERDTERDNFMGPIEAKEYGLIDKVIN